MLKNLKQLQLKEYKDYNNYGENIDIFEYIEDMASDFMEYGSQYISDAIFEIADSSTPIYNNQTWDMVGKIKGWAEEYIEENGGLIDGSLNKTHQYCIFRYLLDGLYANLEELIFNKAVLYLDDIYENLDKETQEKLLKIDEYLIEEYINKIDNDSRIEDIEDVMNELIEYLENDED